MYFAIKLLIFLIIKFAVILPIESEPDWDFDLISITCENHTPDNANIELSISRLSRGVFGISGFIDYRVDVTDDFHVGASIFYSVTGSNFVKSPFFIPETDFSTFMSKFYKDLLMESFLECGVNVPLVEDKFVPPLTKRKIELKDCILSNENMPSKIRPGFYKIVIEYTKQAEGVIEVLAKVDSKL